MNNKVESLIKQARESKKKEEVVARANHLRRIGLIDEDKIVRVYQDYYFESGNYDEEKGLYYKEMPDVLGVTDDEYEEICKYYPPINKDYNFESVFNILGIILYVVGAIGAIYFLSENSKSPWSGEFDEDKFLGALIISILIFFYHFVLGAICQGISKI